MRTVLSFVMRTVIIMTLFVVEVDAKSFLWELNYKGDTSYILGSIHMLKKSDFPLKDELEKSFSKSQYIVVEADISPNKVGEMLMVTMEKAGYKDGSKLADHLSKATFEFAKKKMDELNLSIDNFENFKPWFLSMTITSMELMKIGFDPNYGIEKYFLNKSKGKTILELEGVSFQIGIFDNFSDKENDMFLLSSLKEAESLSENMDVMVRAWRDGDEESLAKIVKKNRDSSPNLEGIFKIIIDKRNISMTGKIENWIKKGGKYFIIVGAAHLVGENGIIKLLREKGLVLKQI